MTDPVPAHPAAQDARTALLGGGFDQGRVIVTGRDAAVDTGMVETPPLPRGLVEVVVTLRDPADADAVQRVLNSAGWNAYFVGPLVGAWRVDPDQPDGS